MEDPGEVAVGQVARLVLVLGLEIGIRGIQIGVIRTDRGLLGVELGLGRRGRRWIGAGDAARHAGEW
jgi:hypothetical protein